MTVGIIAEKPSQAKNFAKALGGMKGSYNGESYIITPLAGHLYEFIKAPLSKQVNPSLAERYDSWDIELLPWDERDFSWVYGYRTNRSGKGTSDAKATVSNVVSALKGCDEIVIATDDDPTGEGTLLAAEVILEAGIRYKKLSRMYFADEAAPSVQKAFKDRKLIANLLTFPEYQKALFRSKWDFLSMQFTRVASTFAPFGTTLRQGRLKSAMVVLVGDQLKAISEYKKVPFYQNRFKDENGVVYSDPEAESYENKADVPGGLHASDVVCDSKQMKSTAPPKLIDLATLSSMLAPKGIPAATTLATYQKMYESQVLSYPRTEDHYITKEQFAELLPHINKIAGVVGVDASCLTHTQPRKTHVKEGMAHGANRPGTNVPASLSELDGKYGKGAAEIYKILALNYLAMLCEDYEYEQQKGHVKDYPTYVGSANVPKVAGWKAVFGNLVDDDDEDDNVAGLGTKADPFIHEGFPPKPQAPTMKWLMKQLEKRNVGTGATRTSVYSQVTANDKSALFKDTKGKISMTDCGDMSYALLPGTHIGSLDLTERVYEQMKAIADGKGQEGAYLHEIQDMVAADIKTMTANAAKAGLKKSAGGSGKYSGTFEGKPVEFYRTICGYECTDDECAKLCAGERIKAQGLKSKKGNSFGAWLKLGESEYKGQKRFGIQMDGFLDERDPNAVPTVICGKKLTKKQQTDLSAGKKVLVKGMTSKKTGKKFDAYLTFNNGKIGFAFD